MTVHECDRRRTDGPRYDNLVTIAGISIYKTAFCRLLTPTCSTQKMCQIIIVIETRFNIKYLDHLLNNQKLITHKSGQRKSDQHLLYNV